MNESLRPLILELRDPALKRHFVEVVIGFINAVVAYHDAIVFYRIEEAYDDVQSELRKVYNATSEMWRKPGYMKYLKIYQTCQDITKQIKTEFDDLKKRHVYYVELSPIPEADREAWSSSEKRRATMRAR